MDMTEKSLSQLIEATRNNDGFAIALLGVCLVNHKVDVEGGVERIAFAADSKNVIWAKNIMLYLRGFKQWHLPIHEHALVDSDAKEQLLMYAAEQNVWAMTILGELLWNGKVMPQNRDEAAVLLNRAADGGCLMAGELMSRYGIPARSTAVTDLVQRFKDKHLSKYWLKE